MLDLRPDLPHLLKIYWVIEFYFKMVLGMDTYPYNEKKKIKKLKVLIQNGRNLADPQNIMPKLKTQGEYL